MNGHQIFTLYLNFELLNFCLGCQKDTKNVTKLLSDTSRDLETYKTAVSKFDIEKQGAKNDSDLVIQKVNELLSICQLDFANLTQVCHDWEKEVISKGKSLVEKDTLISKGDEKLKNCERLVSDKDTSIGILESKVKDCNRDLNNCSNFVARTEADQLKMVNELRDDLHYAGIFSNCCAEKAKLRCNAEMLANRYTCLPTYLLEDTCFEGSSQGQELWDIKQCVTLSDRSLGGIFDGTWIVNFMTANPRTTTILVVLVFLAIVGFIAFVQILISICYHKFWKSRSQARRSSVPENPDLGQSSPRVITPSVNNDGPENSAGETSDVAQNQMNEDIRAAEVACDQAYSAVHEFQLSSGEGAVGPRLPGHPVRPSRLRPPSYEFLARQAQVRFIFSFVFIIPFVSEIIFSNFSHTRGNLDFKF